MQVVQFRSVEESLRVQILIPEKFVGVSVNFVRSGLRYDVHDRSGVAPVLRIKRIRQYAKFGNGVRRWLNRGETRELVVPITAIYCEIVVATAATIHADHPCAVTAINRIQTDL